MKKIRRTTKFKKDLKRYQNNPKTLMELFKVVELLAKGQPIPNEKRPHVLSGNYKGALECHVENDSLLIWIEQSSDGEEIIILSRFGSHSELF